MLPYLTLTDVVTFLVPPIVVGVCGGFVLPQARALKDHLWRFAVVYFPCNLALLCFLA